MISIFVVLVKSLLTFYVQEKIKNRKKNMGLQITLIHVNMKLEVSRNSTNDRFEKTKKYKTTFKLIYYYYTVEYVVSCFC